MVMCVVTSFVCVCLWFVEVGCGWVLLDLVVRCCVWLSVVGYGVCGFV